MKRFALIVKGSTADDEDDPPGITADGDNLVDWLRSNVGGAWDHEEIWSLRSPSAQTLLGPYLATASQADYSLLAFFGHGRSEADNEVMLKINKDEEIPLSQFIATSSRCFRLIDGCRTVAKEELLEGITKVAAAPHVLPGFPRAKHRELFLQQIEQSTPGTLSVFATQHGGTAYGTANGGRFTSSMLSAAKLWTMSGYQPPTMLSVENLFPSADQLTRQINPPQYPEIHTDGAAGFPFAVLA